MDALENLVFSAQKYREWCAANKEPCNDTMARLCDGKRPVSRIGDIVYVFARGGGLYHSQIEYYVATDN